MYIASLAFLQLELQSIFINGFVSKWDMPFGYLTVRHGKSPNFNRYLIYFYGSWLP
jgi:hypothetical protein